MDDKEIARILSEIADLLEIRGENTFKIRAYQKAVRVIETLSEPLVTYFEQDRLESIDGIGKALAEKITEAFETGEIAYHTELKSSLPDGLLDMLKVAGMGPKKVKLVYEKLGIASISELKEAGNRGQLQALPGMGRKTEEMILKSILHLERAAGRFHLGKAAPIAQEILERLRVVEGLGQAEIAGSLRRGKETVGRLILIATASDNQAVIDEFLATENIRKVVSHTETEASAVLKNDLPIELRLVPEDRFGAALLHYTGSEEHLENIKKLAQEKKLEITERGVLKSKKLIARATEDEIYQSLKLAWIPPELREGLDELELAKKNKLPQPLERSDIRAAFHNHTTWSDGRMSIEELAGEAIRRGFEYIAVTDHSGSLGVAYGLTEDRIKQQMDEIHRFNESQDRIHILCGSEVDIRSDGALDFSDDILERLDIVIAAVHIALEQPKDKMTDRVCRALENPHVDILAHPTARLLGRRPPVELDIERVFSTAAETGTAMEINAHFLRLDLNDTHIMQAKTYGIAFTIDTDTHAVRDFDNLEFGLKTARRGRLSPKDVRNTMTLDAFKKWKKRK